MSYELSVESLPTHLRGRIEAVALKMVEAGTVVTARVPGSLGPELAQEIGAAGGQVLSLIPERETLEEWFVRTVEGHPSPDAPEPRTPMEVA